MQRFSSVVKGLGQLESMLALCAMIPVGVSALVAYVDAVPSWSGPVALVFGILTSGALVVWWGERRLRAVEAQGRIPEAGHSISISTRVPEAGRSIPIGRLVAPDPTADEPLPRDEPFVILCRGYALPAYEALCELVSDLTVQCFIRGGWHGLSARLLKDWVVTPKTATVEKVKAGLDGPRSVPLVEDFRELVGAYDELMGLAYQFGCDDIELDQRKLERWGELDRRFETRLSDLSAGINREDLKRLIYPPREGRDLLHGLRKSS